MCFEETSMKLNNRILASATGLIRNKLSEEAQQCSLKLFICSSVSHRLFCINFCLSQKQLCLSFLDKVKHLCEFEIIQSCDSSEKNHSQTSEKIQEVTPSSRRKTVIG